MKTVACPLCGGTESRPVLSAKDPDGLSDAEYRVVRCALCGVQFLNPRPEPAELAPFYPELFYGNRGWSLMTRFFSRFRKALVERRAPKGRLLDVGCGDGAFLHVMSEGGWDVHGIESSASGYKLASSRFGDRVSPQELKERRFPSDFFDVVTLFGVIEHVYDPKALLAEIHRVLKPSGLLLITTQNVASLQARLAGPRWFHLDLPRHLFQFAPETLMEAARQSGFADIRIGTHFLEYNFPGMLQSLLNLATADTNLLYKLSKRQLGGGRIPASRKILLALLLPPAAAAAAVLESAATACGRGGALVLCARKNR